MMHGTYMARPSLLLLYGRQVGSAWGPHDRGAGGMYFDPIRQGLGTKLSPLQQTFSRRSVRAWGSGCSLRT